MNETHELKTDSEDDDIGLHQGQITPRSRKPFVNRIITAGTPTSLRRNAPQPRMPSGLTRLLDLETSPSLSNLASFTSSFGSNSSGPADTSTNLDISAISQPFLACDLSPAASLTGKLAKCGNTDLEGDGERAWFDDEAPSMTIDDILSSSGVSHFDLLGEPHSANGPSFWLGSRTNDCTEQSSEDIDNAALIGDIWE